jgi:hypothetical protein
MPLVWETHGNIHWYLTNVKLSLRDGEIAKKVEAIFDMRPYFIEQQV